MTTPPTRSRTITWDDPQKSAEAGKQMAGLDYLNAIIRGDLPSPPFGKLLGFRPVEAVDGRVVFALTPGEHLFNPIGSIHGGVAATALDSAMACAIHTKLPKGDWYTTVELHLNYVRAILLDTPELSAIGETIYVGGRLATAQGRLVDAAGKLYAHGTTTCMVFRAAKT